MPKQGTKYQVGDWVEAFYPPLREKIPSTFPARIKEIISGFSPVTYCLDYWDGDKAQVQLRCVSEDSIAQVINPAFAKNQYVVKKNDGRIHCVYNFEFDSNVLLYRLDDCSVWSDVELEAVPEDLLPADFVLPVDKALYLNQFRAKYKPNDWIIESNVAYQIVRIDVHHSEIRYSVKDFSNVFNPSPVVEINISRAIPEPHFKFNQIVSVNNMNLGRVESYHYDNEEEASYSVYYTDTICTKVCPLEMKVMVDVVFKEGQYIQRYDPIKKRIYPVALVGSWIGFINDSMITMVTSVLDDSQGYS